MTRCSSLILIALIPSVVSSQSNPITDPLPDSLVNPDTVVQVEQLVRIPNSPGFGEAPRLNMLKEVPDGSGRLFVIDQRGYLYAFTRGGEVIPYLKIRDYPEVAFMTADGGYRQDGFTSFAFHPEFAANGKLYTVASVSRASGTPDFPAKRPIAPGDGSTRQPTHHDVLLEWTADDPTATRFNGSVREVLRIEQPFNDHNVGEVAFNPNAVPGHPDYGMLYLAVADGGNVFPIFNSDPMDSGQDLTVIHGSIVRIDPLGTNSLNGQYGIPDDNPWALTDGPELDEIWAYGFRNPHRLTWDRGGDQSLYTFDIGQWLIEEVNRVIPGGNYGWGLREGSFVVDETSEFRLFPVPEDEPLGVFEYPVAQYDHPGLQGNPFSGSGAIAGGLIYRGLEIPRLYGMMIFADFTSDARAFVTNTRDFKSFPEVLTTRVDLLRVYNNQGIESSFSAIIRGPTGGRTDVRFGEDITGNLYLLNKRNGYVYSLVPTADEPAWPEWVFDAEDSGGERTWSSQWFGEFSDETWPWILHSTLGWLYVDLNTSSPSGQYLVDLSLGWLYTSENLYPWMFDYASGSWLYYLTGSSSPRWFYNAQSGTWLSM